MDEMVQLGLQMLLVNDSYLLEHDVNERSITHKLGEHYQHLFPGWSVDCEFNRNLNGPKEINIDPHAFLLQMADFLDEESHSNRIVDYSILREEHVTVEEIEHLREQLKDPKNLIYDEELDLVAFVLMDSGGKKITKPIFPDIIIHRRGTQENLMVIEAKKTSNKNRTARLYDLVKLNVLTRDSKYAYPYAYFIDMPAKKSLAKHSSFNIQSLRFNPLIRIVESIPK